MSNYLKLEQEKVEMINYYENKIQELKKTNHDSLQRLLSEFQVNLKKVQQEYEDSKKTATNLTDIYERKLNAQEEEHEEEIFEIEFKKEQENKRLDAKMAELEAEQKEVKTQKKNEETARNNMEKDMNNAKAKKKQVKRNLEDKIKQIELLE